MVMTVLHTHRDPKFKDYLRSVLLEANGRPHSVDIAVGYFHLSGFKEVADLLGNRPGQVRILFNNTKRDTRREIDSGYSHLFRRILFGSTDYSTSESFGCLIKLIADGRIAVREYQKSTLHAKVFIGYTGLKSAPGTAIIGSTNLTWSGFNKNLELNYAVTDRDDIDKFRQWFAQLWNESEPYYTTLLNQNDNIKTRTIIHGNPAYTAATPRGFCPNIT